MYSELHCATNFTFLEGASHAEELVEVASTLGYQALAVTDRDTLAGVVRAHVAAKEFGLKLIVGSELTIAGASNLILWANNRRAYGQLARLITTGRRRAPKGECELTLDDIAKVADCGLLAGVVPRSSHFHPEQQSRPPDDWHLYREMFGDSVYLLAEFHSGPDDADKLQQLITMSQQAKLPLVAAGDVHYHEVHRSVLHNILIAIRHGISVDEAGEKLPPNAQYHLQSLPQIAQKYAEIPEAVERTSEIARQCTFSLDELRYEYPEELAPDGRELPEFLADLTWRGAARRYPNGVPKKVERAIDHELALIHELQYEAYFLTVWDLVRFARQKEILCQGRGSAANSAVCYCLGITSVDPDRTDLLFERFISRERDEAPDIDVDFEHARREEVLQYLYDKYGRERSGMTAVVITYRSRSAIRDVGKALGLSLDRVDALAKTVEGYEYEPKLAERCAQVGIDPKSDIGQRLIYLVNEIIGFPRHLSQHVGGMVMTRGSLCELVPIENAAMEGRTVVQWDKDDLESLGILKVDCLALGMLTAIHKCFDLISLHHNQQFNLATVPAADPIVYDMICKADTIGVFQIESRAQMSMLPRLKPRNYYDLVIEVAIVRPGPIQGQMVHPYLRRRAGEEEATYPNKEIEQVLEKTLGVPIFQEQAMKLAVVAAGFTPGEADQLRRAMGAWRRPGIIDQFRIKLINGMQERGLSAQFAEQVFNQIRGFGEYGFPESHAASFALLVYISAWLKHYHPSVFTCSLLNSQPMGFYAPAQLIRDARQHDVEVLPVDVNFSDWDCTLESKACPAISLPQQQPQSHKRQRKKQRYPDLRLGFRMVNGMPSTIVDSLMEERYERGPFVSMDDFVARLRLSQAVMTRLADADAFQSLQCNRRSALWHALGQEKKQRETPLFDDLAEDEPTPAALPKMKMIEEVAADYGNAGYSLRAHPLSFYRIELDRQGIIPASRLEHLNNNQFVRVAGLVLLRQRPSTAKGITFVTLEDETGTINLVVKQPIWDRFYPVARRSPAWLCHGTLQMKDSVIHVVANKLEDLSERLGDWKTKSRDFR